MKAPSNSPDRGISIEAVERKPDEQDVFLSHLKRLDDLIATQLQKRVAEAFRLPEPYFIINGEESTWVVRPFKK